MQYEVARAPGDVYANMAQRVAYLVDPLGTIRRTYQVSDVNTFAADVLADLQKLQPR